MTPNSRVVAVEHATEEMPRESCGLLVIRRGREVYFPCRNIAVGTDNFCLHPEDYASAEEWGDIIGVVHSHPYHSPEPSQADRVACEASGLPWYIVSLPNEQWSELYPTGYSAPLVGRQWSHGVLDCYAIIRDWYKHERGIALPNFERHDDWWHRGENLYLENYEKAGFRRVTDGSLQVGDVIIMQVQSPVPNHAAVYIGDDMILHHIQNRLSTRDVYGGYWRKNTTHIVRYENDSASR